MNMDNGGGGVDEMGFNEAELLYMAAPKQMIVGGTSWFIIVISLLASCTLLTSIFCFLNNHLKPLKLIISPTSPTSAPHSPQAVRSAGTARAYWAATTPRCWWPARAARATKTASRTERAPRDSTRG